MTDLHCRILGLQSNALLSWRMKLMEPLAGIEPTSQPYKGCIMPLYYSGLERNKRLELLHSVWKTDMLTIKHQSRLWKLLLLLNCMEENILQATAC